MGEKNKLFRWPVASTPGGVLAGLLRLCLIETGQIEQLRRRADEYVSSLSDETKVAGKKSSQLIADVVKPEITWKVFIFTIFKILKVRKCVITITLTHANGEVTNHVNTVTTANTMEDNDDIDSK